MANRDELAAWVAENVLEWHKDLAAELRLSVNDISIRALEKIAEDGWTELKILSLPDIVFVVLSHRRWRNSGEPRTAIGESVDYITAVLSAIKAAKEDVNEHS